MYEKGNQLIYELDSVNRQLRLFKDNVYIMEKELQIKIRTEFQEAQRRQRKELEHAKLKFKDYKEDVTLKVSADVTNERDLITKVITKKAEDYKNKEMGQEDHSPRKQLTKKHSLISPTKSNMNNTPK